jgi:hypothetical protein
MFKNRKPSAVIEEQKPGHNVLLEQLSSNLQELTREEAVISIIGKLKDKDPTNGDVVEKNLLPLIDACSQKISDWLRVTKRYKQMPSNEKLLQEVLVLQELREGLEQTARLIRSKITPYLSYSETLARREADLQKFARESEQEFINSLMDGISQYFDQKREILSRRIEQETTVGARLKDTFCKPAAKLIKNVVQKVGLAENESEFAKVLVEKLLTEELGTEILKRDIGEIIEKAKQSFEQSWQRKVAENPPDLETIKSLSGVTTTVGRANIGINLEISSHVLTGGIGAALAATFGVAAGWHTLEWAMLEVFPPAAIIVALLTAATFMFTGDQARESRKKEIEKSIQQYYSMILISLFKQPLKDLNNQTLPQALHQISTQCVKTVLANWEEQISGMLTVEDYRNLTAGLVQYLSRLDDAALCAKEASSIIGSIKIQPELPWWKRWWQRLVMRTQ